MAYNTQAVKAEHCTPREAKPLPDETVLRTMLFDFYGELLTDKQREYFDLHYNADLSLAEIAESSGISRQGVWDIIRRAEATLRETEEKTGLVQRYTVQRRTLADIERRLRALEKRTDGETRELVRQIEKQIAELKG